MIASNRQSQSPINTIHKVVRKMKGYQSAPALANQFGGRVVGTQVAENPIFSVREIVEWTKSLALDPDLITTSSAATKLLQGARDRKHMVLPNLEALSPAHLDYIRELEQTLTRVAPPSETKDSICDERAIPGEWGTLRSAPGRPMQPMGYPIADNTIGREEVPLSPRHEAILRSLMKTVIGDSWTPVNGYEISRKSSSGAPMHSYDVEEKMEMFHTAANNLPEIMRLFRANKVREAVRRFGTLPAYSINRRNQNDKIGPDGVKDRSAPSLGQSIGVEPGLLMAGRRIEEADDFFRTRSRVVYAGNGPINYFLSGMMQPIRDHYLSKFGFTWKHTGAETLQKRLSGWIPVGVDAAQFDQNFHNGAAYVIFDELRAVFTDDVVDLMEMMWTCPAFCPSPVHDSPEQMAWFGDPFDISTFKAKRGLPSGIAYNPDFGKFWGTAYILFFLDDMFGDVLEFGIDRILMGLHPGYAVLNMGDDAIIMTKSVELQRQIVTNLESGDASPYIKLEVEKYLTFLGWVVTKNGFGYQVYPNIMSMVINFLAHEHPVGHPMDDMGHRKHWGLGVESWFEVFGDCPMYKEIVKAWSEVTIKHFGTTIPAIAKPYAAMSKDVLGVSGLSADEARLQDKPERRFYSIDMKNIRTSIIDEIIRTVSPDELTQYCSRYVRESYLN